MKVEIDIAGEKVSLSVRHLDKAVVCVCAIILM